VRLVFVTLLAAAAVIGWCFHTGVLSIPDRHNPWAPLALEDPPGWLTRYKLHRIAGDPALCRRILAAADLAATPVPDRQTGRGCGFENAVRLAGAGRAVVAPTVLSCDSALSFALWERHVVQPAAARQLRAPVARIEHFGSYACRNVGSRTDGRRSRHAVADALDVAAIVLHDGRHISVRRHWNEPGVEGQFLRTLHAGACRFYDAVLGPEYDAAHRDHFHLERGGYRVCR
jgi:hypothetical protein